MRIRIVPTSSGKQAIQVVSKHSGRLTVHKHVGTYANDSEKQELYLKAREYIQEESRQSGLFEKQDFLNPANIIITQSQPLFAYRFLGKIYDQLGLNSCRDGIIKDLIIARIFAPASKRETKEILEELFNRRYSLITIYRHLKKVIDGKVKETFHSLSY